MNLIEELRWRGLLHDAIPTEEPSKRNGDGVCGL